jgi:adenosylcobinamide-phosphate synthase
MSIIVLILDLLIPELPYKIHPTVWIGNLITFLEKKLYKKNGPQSYLNGALLAFTTITITFAFSKTIECIVLNFPSHQIFKNFILLFLASTTVALNSLIKHIKPILRALLNNDLILARKKLSMIVGRDTSELTETEIVRATIEALSESIGDGVVAPLFWYSIFGLPGAFCYRAINTLDSMLGYKNEKYNSFGYFSARIDDFANFIPARLIAFPSFIIVNELFNKNKLRVKSILNFMRISIKEAGKHLSPNAGYYEATSAIILGISLGGKNKYKNKIVYYPLLNPNKQYPKKNDINRMIKLAYYSSIISVILITLIKLFVYDL